MVSYQTIGVNGHEVFYREAGDRAHPTVLLLHGFPTSSHMFRDLIPPLADHYHSGADEIQLDLILDYRSNVALYPRFQEYFRARQPPFLAAWASTIPFFFPPGRRHFSATFPKGSYTFSTPATSRWQPMPTRSPSSCVAFSAKSCGESLIDPR